MANLVLVHSDDPDALLAAAAAPFCAPGRPVSPLPLLAVRQGGIRDQVQERAAAAGCAGWLGQPLVVFGELPGLLAGDLAPLTLFERRALLARAAERATLATLADAGRRRGFVDAVDRLFGDLVSERVMPDDLSAHLGRLPSDGWERARDAELTALYAAYLDEVRVLPPLHGVPRSDGRDGPTVAAEAVRARPDEVRRRIRIPFGDPAAPRSIRIYGLNDLRRGWDHLLDALRAAPFVDEVRVYVLLDQVTGEPARRDRADMEAVGEHDLLDALLARAPERIERVEALARPAPLAHLRRTLFRASAEPRPYDAAARCTVRALAAPDMGRELEVVARRVKALVVDGGVAPHRIAVVSRKSRPYGERAAEVLRRHGVPVTARLRTSLTEVAAVAALLRVFRAAAEGFAWPALSTIVDSPYFDLDVDAPLLRLAGTRRRCASLDDWSRAVDDLAAEAALERGTDDYHGPDAERAARLAGAVRAFRVAADVFTRARTRAEWLRVTLRCIGRDVTGGRDAGVREGLWGLCRNACRPPHSETDALVVDATRRDIEALDSLAGLLMEWRASLAMGGGAADTLSPRAWHAELVEALGETEITLSTPHRRGVQVLEASAAVWRGFDHLFLVGMNGGSFPATASGHDFHGESEREALHAAGLPIEPAGVWYAREASLLRALVGAARESVHVSYAYADGAGAPQLPSAYFDEVVARFDSTDAERPDAWVEVRAGSEVAPRSLDEVWCEDDLQRFAARRWADGTLEGRDVAREALAQLVSSPGQRALVRCVLDAAAVAHARRALRSATLEPPDTGARRWNGEIASPDLLDGLRERFGDAVWSASQLETYGRCPFTFFARYVLGARALDERDEEMDGATRGALLHACLERLHRTLTAEFGDEALTMASRRHAERLIPQIVARALDEYDKLGKGGVPELRRYRERELCDTLTRYLAWEIAENEKAQRRATPRRRPAQFEVTFGMDDTPPVTLQRGGELLRLRGKIDRVDELLDEPVRGWRYVVDHKSGASSLTPLDLYDAGAVLQLPLYVLAVARGAAGGKVGAAGVWGGAYQVAGAECKRAAPLHPYTLAKGQVRHGVNQTEQTAETRLHEALDHALRHVRSITAGQFPARTPSCIKQCPSYCDYKDACREERTGR